MKGKEKKNPRQLTSATWALLMHLTQQRELMAEEGSSSSNIQHFCAKANPEFKIGLHGEAALCFVPFPPVLQIVDLSSCVLKLAASGLRSGKTSP